MLTSIQVSSAFKAYLESLKQPKETYEEVLKRIIALNESKNIHKLLENGYKEMHQHSLKMCNDWPSDGDWEW